MAGEDHVQQLACECRGDFPAGEDAIEHSANDCFGHRGRLHLTGQLSGSDGALQPDCKGSFRRSGNSSIAVADTGVIGFQEQVKTHAREALAARLQRGQEAGELRLGASPLTVTEIIVGALLYRLFTHEGITPGYVTDLTNIVFTGIAPGNPAS